MIKLKKLVEDLIPGGLSDTKSIQDIAEKHNIDISNIQNEVELGIEVEMEHTDDQNKAEEIVLDHLWEIGDYYTRLKEMEKSAINEDDSEGQDCPNPNCGNTGGYPVGNPYNPDQEQCEFCWSVPDSKFNLSQK